MTTPIVEKDEPSYNMNHPGNTRQRSSDDGTVVGDEPPRVQPINTGRPRGNSHLTVDMNMDSHRSPVSPSRNREEAYRLDDELEMLKVERQISASALSNERDHSLNRSLARTRSRTRREEVIDEFDVSTEPIHAKTAVYRPPENPSTNISKFFKKVHNSSFLVRYVTYISPLVLIILIPLLLGIFVFPNATVGGVELVWFSIWLEVVWLTLWAGRVSDAYRLLVDDTLTLII